MKPSILLNRAEQHRVKMETALEALNEKLWAILGEDRAHIEHQPSDGWVVSSGWDDNAKVSVKNIDALLSMRKTELIEELERLGI